MHNIKWQDEPDVAEYRRLRSLYATDPGTALIGLASLADRGSVASMLYLAEEYRNGSGYQAKDLERAKIWYAKASERGYASASYMLGVVCTQLMDNDGAFIAFSKGAALHYLPAIYRLAMMYRDGHGVPQDIHRCRSLLEESASRGHLFSKRDLSTLLIRGAFGPRLKVRGILLLINLFGSIVIFCARSVKAGPRAIVFDERVLA